jgi:hypothetical protein
MGSKTRKAQCTTLYVCDNIKEKCSQRLWSILGVLPCSILRTWRLWARTENEYTMDDFSTLTIREPWLLQRISTSKASTWLAGKGSMLQGRRDLRHEAKLTGISKRQLWRKGRLIKEFHNFLYERWLQAELQNRLAHTFTYFAISGFDNSLFWKRNTFQVDAMHMLVNTLCTCSCGMVLMMHVRMTRLPICVSDCKGNQK